MLSGKERRKVSKAWKKENDKASSKKHKKVKTITGLETSWPMTTSPVANFVMQSASLSLRDSTKRGAPGSMATCYLVYYPIRG